MKRRLKREVEGHLQSTRDHTHTVLCKNETKQSILPTTKNPETSLKEPNDQLLLNNQETWCSYMVVWVVAKLPADVPLDGDRGPLLQLASPTHTVFLHRQASLMQAAF